MKNGLLLTGGLMAVLVMLIVPSVLAVELTFFQSSDTHYGRGPYVNAQNGHTVDAMNGLPGTAYPRRIGGTVGIPVGVIVTGDLTDHYGVTSEWNLFTDDYAVNGGGRINYPVYEGFGNHDIGDSDVVKNGVKQRNTKRAVSVNVSTNGFHYSWDWDNVHFVHLNLYPGGAGTDAEDSLTFLEDDLAANVGTSGRPVVIVYHLTFDTNWWTQAEQDAFYNAIQGYNVVSIHHGHYHGYQVYTWNGIDVFEPGNAFQEEKYIVTRFSGDEMVVIGRVNGDWRKIFKKKTIDLGGSGGGDGLANSDIPVAGTVTGSYTDTHVSDDVYESIEERESGGNPATRYSYLEHKWTIDVAAGTSITFNVEAYHTANSENDDFVFAYSTDDSSYVDMLTVTKTSDDDTYQSYSLPGDTSGTVYIRVRDTDTTAGNKVLDTVYIDHMYIE